MLDRPTAELFARLVKGKRPSDPVFPDPVREGWWDYDSVQWRYEIARDAAMRAGMVKRPRLHDLRHTHAAWLLTDGASLPAVSRRLGHESIQITGDIYGHLEAKADDMIRAIMGGRRSALSDAVATAGKPTPAAATATPSGTRRPANRPATATAPTTRTAPDRSTTGRSARAGAAAVSDAPRTARKALKGRTVPGGRVRRVAGR
ncbi:tyrosine-type recombinase/integrase [Actinosynnema sp. CA-248983]